jgi:glycosyltransferase involved in cell wall biosynthesis
VPTAKLLLAGTGETRAALETQVSTLGLGANVRFLGARSDMPDLLAAADVFVLSSLWEGMPLSVMEAMAAGKPVVCTAVGGSIEIVQDGVNGCLVPSGKSLLLADAMIGMADPEKRALFGKRAAETASAQFGLETMVRAYEGLYAELLSKGKR